ncbi:MAG: hypothetical protein CM15mP101_07040 [Flavobacteriaceae bacterium]|nr:MAG: hypothetical protein CM15mP101_07040 [Flavobacteriaceae bacterium]
MLIVSIYKENTWKYSGVGKRKAKRLGHKRYTRLMTAHRYEASAQWIHNDNKDYWESFTDAPLPRREYTKEMTIM